MGDCIFLINDDKTLVEMVSTSYDSEDLLQKLLADYPQILAGEQINSEVPRKWLLINREIGVPGEENGNNRWALDHLFLDQEGIPTLVEVKRSTDTRLRREVVGQMLDYAANGASFWPIDYIQACYQQRCSDDDIEPDETLQEFLDGDEEVETYWQKVKTNLQAGKIRMVFVSDMIPPELARVIEFLNNQMDPAEVLGIEIKQYVSSKLKTLVPRVIGNTSEAKAKKSVTRNTPRKPIKELELVIEAYEKINVNNYELRGGGTTFKIVKVPEFPKPVHYEFMYTKANGCSVEIHIENEYYRPLSDRLKRITETLPPIEGRNVAFDQKFRNGLGGLKILFGLDEKPETVAKAMEQLISETKQKLSDEIKRLGLS